MKYMVIRIFLNNYLEVTFILELLHTSEEHIHLFSRVSETRIHL